MGLIIHDISPEREIAVWLTNGEPWDGCVTAGDMESAERFASAKRRNEHLAARAALRSIVPDAVVEYDQNGAPVLTGGDLHVGLSHCEGAGAAIVSRQPCAIDIEPCERNFKRAIPKYLSAGELTVEGCGHEHFPAAGWCAKETLYKLGRTPGTSLIDDMKICKFDPRAGIITVRMRGVHYNIGVRMAGEFIFCFNPL